MKIDWNKDNVENARYMVSDGVTTCYVSEDQISTSDGMIASMESVAESYSDGYDHNGTDDEYAVCRIIDTDDDEMHKFAFDGHGNFEWCTKRQG